MTKQDWKELKEEYEEGKDAEHEGMKMFDMFLAKAILDLKEQIDKLGVKEK